MKYIYLKQKRLTYYYLYYIKVNNDEDFIQNYKELVRFILNSSSDDGHSKSQQQKEQQNELKKEKQDFEKFFLDDMKLCQQDDGDLFCFLILFIYKNFSAISVNNSEMLFLIVNCIDSIQCKNLLSLIISDELKLLKATMQTSLKFIQCLYQSLQWDTLEQIFFWKLLFAHNNITIDYLLPLVPKLDSIKHCEAICDLFQILKLEDPTIDIVQCVFCRKEDNITRALFIYWSKNEDTTLKKHVIKLLEKLFSNLAKNITNEKLKSVSHPPKKQQVLELEMPSLDQVLAHLNQLRLNNDCLKLILDETVQDNLQKLYKNHCNDDLKRRYADLFTLIDEFDENSFNANKKGGNKHSNKKQQNKLAASNSSSSQDKNKTAKRVKTTGTTKTVSKKMQSNYQNSSTSDSDIEDVTSAKQPPRKKHKLSDNESD